MKKIAGLLLGITLVWVVNSASANSWQTGKVTFWSDKFLGPGVQNNHPDILCIMNADGSDVTELMDWQRPTECGVFSLSPDCEKIAFRMEKERVSDIVIFEINREKFINLTKGHPGDSRSPRWSSDGRKIVFYDTGNHPCYEIYTINSDGTDLKMIGEGEHPDFSPYGRQIVFEKDADIYIMDADGDNVLNLTNGRIREEFRVLRWSPDGRQILFSTFDGEQRDSRIYTMDSDGGNLKNILKTEDVQNVIESVGTSCCWSPDGEKIAFVAVEKLHHNSGYIWVMDPDGINVERLTNHHRVEFATYEGYVDWQYPASFFGVDSILRAAKTTWGRIKSHP